MSPHTLTCRACGGRLPEPFLDLGPTPLANAFLSREDLARAEPFYPLEVYSCRQCFLVQVPVVRSPAELFSDYAYFSSYSRTWLKHASDYADRMVRTLGLGPGRRVLEIASNDGYLLQFFQRRGVEVLGVEPARNVAAVARAAGIETIGEFFGARLGERLARQGWHADLVVANNVLAHVPDLDDFVSGLRAVLATRGLITVEVPHLLHLIAENQFDTIYHEHLSYFSLTALVALLERHDLVVVDVEELSTHGGSLRVHLRRREEAGRPDARVRRVLDGEAAAGLTNPEAYAGFAERVRETKRALLDFLIAAKRKGANIAGYGAPAKGNTLLNYCGVRTDFLDYTVDRSPHKQGRFLPGTRIPIEAPARILETRPDYVLILAWNLKDEIMEEMAAVREWGGRFVVPIPRVEICS